MRQGNLVLRLSILAHGKVIIEYMVVSSLYLHVAPSELELCDMIELAVSVSHEHHEHQPPFTWCKECKNEDWAWKMK